MYNSENIINLLHKVDLKCSILNCNNNYDDDDNDNDDDNNDEEN